MAMDKNEVVQSYEHYKEEDRLSTNNARRLEFITTIRTLDELIRNRSIILDCAAGTGIYAFYLADKGHKVTATDITPRHVEVMKQELQLKKYDMHTLVMDATNMSIFADESFDVVLNMVPFYRLISKEDRDKCMSESLRVLKKGGLIFTAYIPRFYICNLMAMTNQDYVNKEFLEQIVQTGIMNHDDELCFWTDAYFSTAEEMEQEYIQRNIEIIDHFSQDGLAPLFSQVVDAWNEDEFKTWSEHHYQVCREKSILGQSNHVIIVGRKK